MGSSGAPPAGAGWGGVGGPLFSPTYPPIPEATSAQRGQGGGGVSQTTPESRWWRQPPTDAGIASSSSPGRLRPDACRCDGTGSRSGVVVWLPLVTPAGGSCHTHSRTYTRHTHTLHCIPSPLPSAPLPSRQAVSPPWDQGSVPGCLLIGPDCRCLVGRVVSLGMGGWVKIADNYAVGVPRGEARSSRMYARLRCGRVAPGENSYFRWPGGASRPGSRTGWAAAASRQRHAAHSQPRASLLLRRALAGSVCPTVPVLRTRAGAPPASATMN